MLYIVKIQEDSPHFILDVYMFYLTVVMIYYSLSTLSSLDVLEEHFSDVIGLIPIDVAVHFHFTPSMMSTLLSSGPGLVLISE